MSLETEAVLDRRRLRRSLSLWRVLTVLAAAAAIGALAMYGTSDDPVIGGKKQIARVALEGVITENRDQIKLLKQIADAKHVEALILFINSPGGTTTGGEALYEAIRNVAAKKPVVAQFGTIATSAAYICGLATDQIFARGNTITGSVGVIFQWAEISELLAKVGVKMNEIKSGPLKATPSPFQPIDPAGKAAAERMIADSMVWFQTLVATRRGIDTTTVPGLVQGGIFSGREALGYKLIDQIGGETEAVGWLVEKRGVHKGLKVVDWKPKATESWGVLGMTGMVLRLLGINLDGRFSAVEPGLASLMLDGLVSIWQPTEN
jgi:protease-4